MFLVYGKGTTGKAVSEFLTKRGLKFKVVDDSDFHPDVLNDVEEVIISPGVPFFAPIYKEARKRNIPVVGEIEFAFRFKKGKIIAITGTDGKSTTTKLVYDILKNAGKDAYIGGNYGTAFISFVDKLSEDSITVLELSSFQLYSTKNFKPDIAVVLNIDVDHLNWHKTLRHYICSKLKITKNQGSSDYLIVNKNLLPLLKKVKAKVLTIGDEPLDFIDTSKLKLVGKHNLQNIEVAVKVGRILGVNESIIKDTVENFEPLEHRLEFIGKVRGVSFYNDAKSTTVQATKKALESFEKNVILIAGGINKGGDFSKIKKVLKERCKAVILIGKDKEEISKMIDFNPTFFANSLQEAVKKAVSLSEKDDTILFSPGCASFDMFKNYIDRGNQFKKLVKALKDDS